ncbi:MAG: patatin-like phospholipase family protein [Burkholderiales bacterium]|nr:patatin-like phospholipase family protein [Burkholderiales bacterium]
MPAPAKPLNLALQGGGSHGAFTWGVLDRLLEDGRVRFDGLCGTSAGAMNAVVCAYGHMRGGADGARAALEDFWRRVSEAATLWSPVRAFGLAGPWAALARSASYAAFDAFTRAVSPYQSNPLNVNPLREVLEAAVDFDAFHACRDMRVFVCATNVRSGKPRVFHNREMSADAVLASACLPYLFQAVEIDGEAYWDGGYVGNPAIFPLIYETETQDIMVVHINPLQVAEVPRTAADILDRVNEISFNSSLVREMRAIAFVQKLIADDWLKDEYRDQLRSLRMHAIRADADLGPLGIETKLDPDWGHLLRLRDLGRARAAAWLAAHFGALGRRSTVDIRADYL